MITRNGDGPPATTTIDLTELKSYDGARPYIGMLVRVENVTINGDTKADGSHRYCGAINVGASAVADVPKICNELYDIEHSGPALSDMKTFKSVTGVVTYFYGFHLVPRSPADFEE